MPRPLAISAAVRFAFERELPDVPTHVCPPCRSSHGSRPLTTPAETTSHALVVLTPWERAFAQELLLDVRTGWLRLEDLDGACDIEHRREARP